MRADSIGRYDIVRKIWLFGLFVAAVGIVGMGQSASAQSATEKLGRGVANTFLGVFEIPNQVFNTYRENTGKSIPTREVATMKAITVGPVRGVREAFRRTGHGIWDTVTFLSPGPGGNDFKSRIQPEYMSEVTDY
jgi:putative exosortase-associated protein (TIGR04073 family)